MKLEFSRKIADKSTISWKYVEWKPSFSMRTDGQKQTHDETNSRFSQIYDHAWNVTAS